MTAYSDLIRRLRKMENEGDGAFAEAADAIEALSSTRSETTRIDVEGRDFYELCQQYRHSSELPPMVGMMTTVQAFEALKTYIKTGRLPWPSYDQPNESENV